MIVDDERLLRTGFRVILENEPDITVVGEAADGRAAIDVVRRRRSLAIRPVVARQGGVGQPGLVGDDDRLHAVA